MRHRLATLLVTAVVATTVVALGGQTDSAGAALDAARKVEVVDGNLQRAIGQYQAIVSRYGKTDRAVAAEALVRMAECYEKLGKPEAAQGIYAQVAKDYSDQAAFAASARARLVPQTAGQAGIADWRRICAGCVGDKIKDFTLSSDGRSIGWTAGEEPVGENDDLMALDVATGISTRLVDVPKFNAAERLRYAARRAVWSPDLRQVAYQYRDVVNRRPQLRILENRVGGSTHTVVDNPEFVYVLPTAWSPDGRILVMIQLQDFTWQLAWVSPGTGTITVLKSLNWQFDEFGNGPELSPDGRHIVYCALTNIRTSPRDPADSSKTLYVLAADGSYQTSLVAALDEHVFPVWAPDGSRIFFVSDMLTQTPDLLSVAVRGGRLSGAPSVVKSGIGWPALVGVTRAGILYHVRLEGGYERTLVDGVSGSGPITSARALGNRSGKPSWSPDGSRLVSSTGGGLVVHSVETGGDQVVSLGSVGVSDATPHWSSDGTALVVSGRNAGRTVFLRVDLETSAVQRLTEFNRNGNPTDVRTMFPSQTAFALSPDGSTAYVGAGTGRRDRMLAFDLASGEAKVIATLPGPNVNIHAVTVRPDGRTLAVTISEGPEFRSAGGPPEGPSRSKIVTIGVDGTGYRSIHGPFDGPRLSEATWAADGQSLFVGYHEDDGTWSVSQIRPDGGQPRRVGAMASEEVKRNGASHDGFTVSADGRRAAFFGWVNVRDKNELWALDLSSLFKTPQ